MRQNRFKSVAGLVGSLGTKQNDKSEFDKEVTDMRKMLAVVLMLTCLLGVAGCSSMKVDKTKSVFETDNISSISFYTMPDHNDGIQVPDEYIEEIKTWLSSFRLDEKVKNKQLPPGSNSVSVKIVYSDGTTVKNGLSTFTVDGTLYYLSHDDAPECYLTFWIVSLTNSSLSVG